MRTLAAIALFLFAQFLPASDFIEGRHYQRIDPVQPTQSGDKIEVVEVFLYTCPSCNRLAPLIADWKAKKSDDVVFSAVPAGWDGGAEAFARTHYSAEVLGAIDKTHQPLFDAIHREGIQFGSVEELVAWYAQFGITNETMQKTMNSFAVDNRVASAQSRILRWGVGGVPTIIVNGKYRFDPTEAGSHQKTIELIDFLVQKEREAKN